MFSTDRISLLLGVGAIVVTLGVGTCSTNARIDDLSDSVNRRFDDLSDSVNRRFDQVRADIRELRADHVRSDERSRSPESVFTFPGIGVHVQRNTHVGVARRGDAVGGDEGPRGSSGLLIAGRT